MQQAMSLDRPFSDVRVILQTDYFPQENSTTPVPVSIELAGDGVKFEEKGNVQEAKNEFLAHVAEGKGHTDAVARDQVHVRLPNKSSLMPWLFWPSSLAKLAGNA
jgi:hypothetical protein